MSNINEHIDENSVDQPVADQPAAESAQQPQPSGQKAPTRRRKSVYKKRAKRPVKHADQLRPSADDAPRGIAALKPPLWLLALTAVLVITVCVGLVVEGTTPAQAIRHASEKATEVFTHLKDKSEGHDQELYGDNTWRTVAINAEYYFDVDTGWTDVVLAMIHVESDGDIYIDDQGDIMQTAEGDGSPYLYNGVPEMGVEGGTPEASIYAGVFELRHCIASYVKHLGRNPNPKDEDDVGLIAQAYNYGHEGWFMYCARNGITSWSLDASEDYQAQIGGIGTANHGAKVQAAWEEIRAKKKK